jgi:hypothetical protein
VISHSRLGDLLEAAMHDVRSNGDLTWDRVSDWTVTGQMPSRGERGGGMADGEPDDRIDDRKEDAAAARYHDELSALTRRLEADLHRIVRIIGICCPTPTRLASRDMLSAQVAADGWCVSCWKDDQNLTPITMTTGGGKPRPRYKDRCRFCGEWKAEHGQDPPLPILQLMHDGRRITTAAIERAMGKSA